MLAPLFACETYSSTEHIDAGADSVDVGSPAVDAPPVDAHRVSLDIGPSCATDADCEDGNPDTHAYCHAVFRVCIDTECTTDAHCDDHDPCTLDYCLAMANCGHGSDNCCTTDADCADGDECTNDVCGADSTCDWTAVVGPGCTPCPDRDGDGSGALWCGGTDCDDLDPARAATLPEHCGNGIDDDCDGASDLLDTACHPENLVCPGVSLALGEATHGTTITDGAMPPASDTCGASAFYTLTLTGTSDVEVTLRLDTPPPPTPACPDCPPPSGPMQINPPARRCDAIHLRPNRRHIERHRSRRGRARDRRARNRRARGLRAGAAHHRRRGIRPSARARFILARRCRCRRKRGGARVRR